MATSSHRLLLRLSILLGVLAIAATARPGRPFHPCKTLIFFTSTTSSSSHPLSRQNPNLAARRSVTFYITELRQFDPRPALADDRAFIDFDEVEEKRPLPFGLYSSAGASFRERTKDILNVVASLLFGVGCGFLTGSTLYLIWSLFASSSRDSDDKFDDYEEDVDDISPKKMGYVAIPAADAPAAAKEVA
ncbi:uncharacterized protein LOC127804929 [Diospyros lotus]|uniref:uncharacterized protein LOC127804929 n=1 Tax=Diospyros lotus TaxID=55363 RepID=UPI0022522C6E|nr:uncharacterized protein LOC127804929 [Diospyros lotus]